MNPLENDPFLSLFRAAARKCFSQELVRPLSEPESRHFSNAVFEQTGLVIGPKSLRNYAAYACGKPESKTENPSVATLDTLARYVLGAPYTDEPGRKKNEGHFPWWFRYKMGLADEKALTGPATAALKTSFSRQGRKTAIWSGVILLLALAILLGLFRAGSRHDENLNVSESFDKVAEDSLTAQGWTLWNRQENYWARRGEKTGRLTLFTLTGDNWVDSEGRRGIANLLVRKIPSDCFSTEVHLEDFFPSRNWQQAGILLLQDSGRDSPGLRFSVAFNNFFGGYARDPEILLQGIRSTADDAGKPEEIIHLPLFVVAAAQDSLVRNNLRHTAIRIEKTGKRYRILYAAGPLPNFAFREAISKEIDFQPRYLCLFALQGFVADTTYLPVRFSYFSFRPGHCNN